MGGDGANMVLIEKLTKNWKLRGLKLRGLGRNQITTANFIYQNDQCQHPQNQHDSLNQITLFEIYKSVVEKNCVDS